MKAGKKEVEGQREKRRRERIVGRGAGEGPTSNHNASFRTGRSLACFRFTLASRLILVAFVSQPGRSLLGPGCRVNAGDGRVQLLDSSQDPSLNDSLRGQKGGGVTHDHEGTMGCDTAAPR